MNKAEIDIYKNFLLNKIDNNRLNIEAIGNGDTIISNQSRNDIQLKTISGGINIDIDNNYDELVINSLNNIGMGMGNKLLVLDQNNEIKYMIYQKVYGSIYFVDNIVITPLDLNIWADINTSGYMLSDDRINILDSSILDGSINIGIVDSFIGILLCNIVLENTQTGYRIYQVGIFLNDILIPDSLVINEVNQRMNEVTTHSIITLNSNDKVKIKVRNITNNNDCRITNIHFTVLKLDNKL